MTKYIKEEQINNKLLKEIGLAIKNGQTVIFKTDTVYGIGTNAYDEKACQKIYEIKGRPSYKPLCILISDLTMLEDVTNTITEAEQKLIKAFWPGPLTIKFKKKAGTLPDIVSAGDEYVRVRLLDNSLAYNLIKASGVPIVAPSANLSGSPTGINIENIMQELGGKVDYIIDSGNVTDDTTSTIVEIINEEALIIREGKITKEDIAKIVPLKKDI